MSHTKAPHKAGLSSPPSSGAGHPVLRSYIFELADKATLLTDSGATVVLNKGSTPSVVGSWDSFAKPSPMTFSEVRGSFGALGCEASARAGPFPAIASYLTRRR